MSIPNMMRDIKDFHEKFGIAYSGPPRALPYQLKRLRDKFMTEELGEYQTTDNLEKELDAIVDLVYVALGTAHLHGFDFDEAWRRVHEANMKKVRAPGDAEHKLGVLKPEGWKAPYLSDLVR